MKKMIYRGPTSSDPKLSPQARKNAAALEGTGIFPNTPKGRTSIRTAAIRASRDSRERRLRHVELNDPAAARKAAKEAVAAVAKEAGTDANAVIAYLRENSSRIAEMIAAAPVTDHSAMGRH